MNMFVALFVVVLLPALAIEASFFTQEKPGDDINALCMDQDIDLSSFAQIKQLAAKVGGTWKCNAASQTAIIELEELYNETKDDLCSASSMKKFEKYYTWRLQNQFAPMLGEDPEKRPDSLKRFVIAYGLQVSSACKQNMLEALTGQDGQRKLEAMGEEAEDLFRKLTSDGGPIEFVLGDLANRDEPLMPGDLEDFLSHHNNHENQINVRAEHARMSEASQNLIEKVHSVCKQRFRPIYAPYMLPLVELANMGLSYRSQELESRLEDPVTAKEIGRWSRVAFACETLESLELGVREQPSYKSPKKVTLADEHKLIYDKSDKRLVAAIKSTSIGLSKQRFVSQKVSRMAAEARVPKPDVDNLDNLVRDVLEGSLSNEDQDGAAQRLMEVLDQYAAYYVSA